MVLRIAIKIHLAYLWYVLRHKWYVFIECCKLGIPWLGIIHDWSKFRLSEWFAYVYYFHIFVKDHKNKNAYYKPFDWAWFLHGYKRNKHHWEYYVMHKEDGTLVAFEMPKRYLKEMLADWKGAGKAQGNPNTCKWYLENRNNMILHKKTKQWIEERLI